MEWPPPPPCSQWHNHYPWAANATTATDNNGHSHCQPVLWSPSLHHPPLMLTFTACMHSNGEYYHPHSPDNVDNNMHTLLLAIIATLSCPSCNMLQCFLVSLPPCNTSMLYCLPCNTLTSPICYLAILLCSPCYVLLSRLETCLATSSSPLQYLYSHSAHSCLHVNRSTLPAVRALHVFVLRTIHWANTIRPCIECCHVHVSHSPVSNQCSNTLETGE